MIEVHYPVLSGHTAREIVSWHTFSGGEEHVNLMRPLEVDTDQEILVKAQLLSSQDVMRFFLLVDALKRQHDNEIHVEMPYLPYARQDRACAPGDAFSLAVFARMLNGLDVQQFRFFDVHSPTALHLIYNSYSDSATMFAPSVASWMEKNNVPLEWVVAPDKGAASKAVKFRDALNRSVGLGYQFAQAGKVRDPQTGYITGTEVDVEDFKGGACLIPDDICDGGRTFTELAKVLNAKNAGDIYLYVSHGIFSKGIDVLIENGIKHIFTTDSIPQVEHPAVTLVHRFFGEN